MKIETEKLIAKYAHDYCYMQLSDEEFRKVLMAFMEELLELEK